MDPQVAKEGLLRPSGGSGIRLVELGERFIGGASPRPAVVVRGWAAEVAGHAHGEDADDDMPQPPRDRRDSSLQSGAASALMAAGHDIEEAARLTLDGSAARDGLAPHVRHQAAARRAAELRDRRVCRGHGFRDRAILPLGPGQSAARPARRREPGQPNAIRDVVRPEGEAQLGGPAVRPRLRLGGSVGQPRGIREGVGGDLEEVLQDERGGDLGGVDAGVPPCVLRDQRLLPRNRIEGQAQPVPGLVGLTEGQPGVLAGERLGQAQACALS